MKTTVIAIIGAGPTGLMLANLLGKAGIHTTIFEKRKQPFTEPRAIAFDPETLRLFQSIGCYQELTDTLELDVPVGYYNASGKTLAHITDCPPLFGHSGRGTYYQPELEAVLADNLKKYNSVSLHRDAEVISLMEKYTEIEIDLKQGEKEKNAFTSKYVIDCSGGSSRIRNGLGIQFAGNTFSEKWLVIDVVGDDYCGREIQFFCDPKRPAVTLPVSKNRRRWEFLIMPGDDETKIVQETNARSLMATYGAGQAKKIERSLIYTFHARFAERFKSGRVILAGDSAHVMPPFAGQGLNSGMRDAANLAWKLTTVVQGQVNNEILETYDPERRTHVHAMTKLTILLGRTIMPTNHFKAWIRDRIMLSLWHFSFYRKLVNRGDVIPKPSIKDSPLVNWSSRKPVGEMIVQPEINTNEKTILLDDLMGAGFWAIAVNCNISKELHAEDAKLLQQLKAKTKSISSDQNHNLDGYDCNGELLTFLGMKKAIIIVRPDRFVIDVFKPQINVEQLLWMKTAYGITKQPVNSL